MNQELMNMVQQAVNSIPDHVDFEIPNAFAEAFAALVRADEREARAKVCDEVAESRGDADECATEIRARGETK
jgi:hypothetical protein